MQHIHLTKSTIAVLLLLGITLFGTAGYWFIDRYPPVDALYMSVITITTVGFGEIYPLSAAGRLFTVVLILLSFVMLGFVGHSLVESMLERVWSGTLLEKKMKKRIANLENHYVICGYGRVGEIAAHQLKAAGKDFVVIETSESVCERCRENGYLYFHGDATRGEVLLGAAIKNSKGLIALLDSDPLNLFIVLTARELNPLLHIIARCEDRDTERKILRAGADSIISPFDSAGKRVAEKMLAATGLYDFPDTEANSAWQPRWINIQKGSGMIGTTVAGVAKNMAREVLGVRRGDQDQLRPSGKMTLQEGDQLLVLAEPVLGENSAQPLSPRRVVIVDDNPVILRLYSRLFQKAGFHPITAENGDQGYTLIREELPEVAVIDFKLPGLSGLEICQKVRKDSSLDRIKLVVFTADDDPELRQRCLESGADEMLVKSAEASEIIGVVMDQLNIG